MTERSTDQITALHHPVRRRVLETLQLDGPATVGTLAEALGQQVGSVSHHLKTLERAGFVEKAPELARDRRESWWRRVPRTVSWSVSDFAGSEADTLLATAAERENLQHHVDKVQRWYVDRDDVDTAPDSPGRAWVDAAFATETWATATPQELTDLSTRMTALLKEWAAACATAADEDPGAERRPVFVFAHGNPARP